MDDSRYSRFTLMVIGFLILNSVMVIYRSNDHGSVAFVVISYLDLLALFYCFCPYERDVSRYGHARGSLKAAVWLLSTLLAVMYSFKMAALFSQPISGSVFAMSTILSLLLFYEFFVHRPLTLSMHPSSRTGGQQPMENDSYSWLSILGFVFLTFNSVMAIKRSKDPCSAAFVVTSFLGLLLLFWCLHKLERTAPQYGHIRIRLKAAVWLLSTSLTIIYSFKMAALFPLPISGVSFVMSTVLSLLTFYEFFIHRNPEPNLLPTYGPDLPTNHEV